MHYTYDDIHQNILKDKYNPFDGSASYLLNLLKF